MNGNKQMVKRVEPNVQRVTEAGKLKEWPGEKR